jgi:hypothetical protein
VALVSPRFFETVGTQAVRGRLLTASDAASSAPPAAVIAEELWRGPFNSASAGVGGPIVVGGRPFTIVGVAPARTPGLRLVDLGTQDTMLPQVWVGLEHAQGWRANAQTSPWLTVAGRLAPHAEWEQARAQISALAERLKTAALRAGDSLAGSHRSLVVFRGGLDWRDDPGQALLTLAVFLLVPSSILAIACINVMSLQFARGLDNRRS